MSSSPRIEAGDSAVSSVPDAADVPAAAETSSDSAAAQPQGTLTGVLEEVDDAAELLKQPFEPQPLVPEPASEPAKPALSAEQEARRAERRARLAGRAAPSTMPPEERSASKARSSASTSHASVRSRDSTEDVEQPSKRARTNGSGEGRSGVSVSSGVAPSLMVGGSGARAPTKFLDASGDLAAPSASSSHNGDAALRVPVKTENNGRRARKEAGAAIDLTVSDDDEDVQITATKRNSDVQIDEQRTNAPVCLGAVNGVVLCLHGLPRSLLYDGHGRPEDLPQDPAYEKRNWPRISSFWSQPGYRPILLSIHSKNDGPVGPRGSSDHIELNVSTVQPPLVAAQAAIAHARARGLPEEPAKMSAVMLAPFGALSEKHKKALLPLLTSGLIRCEARCKMAPAGRGSMFTYPIEILIFTTSAQVGRVTSVLLSEAVQIDKPICYEPSDYPQSPRLVYSRAALPEIHGAGDFRQGPSIFTGGYGGHVLQTKEQTEEERKKQVDSVYDSLRSGDDLPETEPHAVIITKLFPHQKQALSFLLEREEARSFDLPPPPKEAENGAGEKSENGEGKGKSRAAPEAEETVSLWKAIRKRDGTPRAYLNVVTNSESLRRPEICRGAILADDMGLGKTITTIALIAHTYLDARKFGKSKPTPADPAAAAGSKGQEEHEDAFTGNVPGAPPGRMIKKSQGGGKVQAKRDEAERVRRKNIRTRSRATLIVLPLTLVSSWEEQIKEHTDPRWRDRHVLIYHGANRSSDPLWIANHDIVLTTYATLANEFSNQKTWVADGDEDEDAQEAEDSDPDIVLLDELGRPILSAAAKAANAQKAAAARKQATKRRRMEGGESKNPLQRIEWFRIVLDEAHTIKETRTWQSKATCNLSGQRRLCLTGTPVQNRLDDLYALIKFLRLEPFSDRATWNEFCGSRDKGGGLRATSAKEKASAPVDGTSLRRIQTIMKFLTLRRSKDGRRKDGQRLLNLPPKYSRTLMLDFDPRERAVYAQMHQSFKEEFELLKASDTLKLNYATILHEISNLRMVCDHEALVDDSKDLKRKKNGEGNDAVQAIVTDGLTRQRAAALFALFAGEDQAECGLCGVDLTRSDEEAAAGGPAAGDGKMRPVVTKCQHMFCTPCFRSRMPAKWPNCKADDRAACPACDIVLGLLVETVQLQPSDIESRDGSGEGLNESDAESDAAPRKKVTFGADANTPISKRTDLSSKMRALLADITPFSQCNPHSLLFDADAPLLQHLAISKGTEPVVIAQHPPTKDGGPDNILPVKSVVFSQWTKMLDRVQIALERAGIKSVMLDGRMKRDLRASNIEQFKTDPGTEVLLVSIKVGGTGLNLTEACRAYLIEPAWNPSIENQALDRIHRLGQQMPVITTKLVMTSSIEERMLALQRHKLELAEKSVGESGRGAKGKSDLQRLLEETDFVK